MPAEIASESPRKSGMIPPFIEWGIAPRLSGASLLADSLA